LIKMVYELFIVW